MDKIEELLHKLVNVETTNRREIDELVPQFEEVIDTAAKLGPLVAQIESFIEAANQANVRKSKDRVHNLDKHFRSALANDIKLMCFAALGEDVQARSAENGALEQDQSKLRERLGELEQSLKDKNEQIKKLETVLKTYKESDPRANAPGNKRPAPHIEESTAAPREPGQSTRNPNLEASEEWKRLLAEERATFERQIIQLTDKYKDLISTLATQHEAESKAIVAEFEAREKAVKEDFKKTAQKLSDSIAQALAKAAKASNSDPQVVDSLIQSKVELERESAFKHFEDQLDDLTNRNHLSRIAVDSANRQNDILRILLEEVKIEGSRYQLSREGGSAALNPYASLAASNFIEKCAKSAESKKSLVGQIRLANNLKKSRILNHILRGVSKSIKFRAFYKVFASKVYSVRSNREAGTRLRGRMLDLLFKRYSDVGAVRKAYFKWAVIINPNLIRGAITKVALTAKIKPQVAMWRLKKLIEKNIKVKLPEAVRKNRFAEALHVLQRVAAMKKKNDQIASFNRMRPQVVGRRNRLLINLLNKKAANDMKNKEVALDRLKANKRKRDGIAERLVRAYKSKVLDAYLRMHNRWADLSTSAGANQFSSDLIATVDMFKDKVRSSVEKLLRTPKFAAAKLFCERLASNSQGNLADSLHKLRRLNKAEKTIAASKEYSRKGLMDRLVSSCRSKQKAALDRLRRDTAQTAASERVVQAQSASERAVKEKVRNTGLRRLVASQAAKSQAALHKLQQANAQKNKEEALKMSDKEKKQFMRERNIGRLVRAQLKKSEDAIKRLRGFNNEQQKKTLADQAKKQALFKKLCKSQQGKLGQLFEKLKDNAVKLSVDDKFKEAMDKLKNEKTGKGLEKLAALARKKEAEHAKAALGAIKQEGLEASRLAQVESAKREKKQTTLGKLLRDLVRAQNSKRSACFSKLRNNWQASAFNEEKTQLKQDITARKQEALKKNLLAKLKAAQQAKAEDALNKLADRLKQSLQLEQDRKIEGLLRREKTNKALTRVIGAHSGKQAQAFAGLRRFTLSDKVSSQAKAKIFSRLLNDLRNAQRAKTRDAFKHLVAEGRLLSEKNLNRFLRGKIVADRLSAKCAENLIIAKELAYRKLISFSQKTDSRMERARYLFNKLVAASNMKLKEATFSLRHYNLYANNITKLNETLIGEALDRELMDKRKLFKNLYKAQGIKALICLRTLKYFNQSEQERAVKMKNSVMAAVFKGTKNMYSLREACYRKMLLFLRTSRDKELKTKKNMSVILRKIEQNCRQNQIIALAILTRFKEKAQTEGKLTEKLLARIFSRLRKACDAKQSDALKQAAMFKSGVDRDSISKDSSRRGLFRLLAAKMKDLQAIALKNLEDFSVQTLAKDEKLKTRSNRLANGLVKAQEVKMVQAFSKLMKLQSEGEAATARKKEQAGLLLARRLYNSAFASMESAFQRAKLQSLRTQSKEKELHRGRFNLLSSLARAQAAKLNQALKALKLHSAGLGEKQSVESDKKNRLVKELVNAYKNKTQHAHQLLDSFKSQAVQNEQGMKNLEKKLIGKLRLDRLVEKLIRAQQEKVNFAMNKLSQNWLNEGAKLSSSARLKHRLLRHLVKGQEGKLRQALNQLNQNRGQAESKGNKKQLVASSILNQLVVAQKLKRAICFSLLVRFNKGQKLLEAEKQNKLRKIESLMSKAAAGKQAQGLEALRRNGETHKKGAEKKSGLAKLLVRAQTAKQKEAFSKCKQLNDEAVSQARQGEATCRRALNNLIRAQNDKLKAALKKLATLNLHYKGVVSSKTGLKKASLGRLVAAHESKMKLCLDYFTRFSGKAAEKEARAAAGKKKLLGRVISAQEEKQRQCFSKLAEQSRRLADKVAKDERQKKRVLALLKKAYTDKTFNALDLLRKNASQLENADVMNRTMIENEMFSKQQRTNKLLKMLIKAQTLKVFQANNKLKANHSEKLRQREVQSDLLKLLARKLAQKLACALDNLVRHHREAEEKEKHQRNLKLKLFKNLQKASYSRLAQAYYKLTGRQKEHSGKFVFLASVDKLLFKRYHQAMEKIKLDSNLAVQKGQLAEEAKKEREVFGQKSLSTFTKLSNLHGLFLLRLKDAFDKLQTRRRQMDGFKAVLDKCGMKHRFNLRDALNKLRANAQVRQKRLDRFGQEVKKANIRANAATKAALDKLRQNHQLHDSKLDKLKNELDKAALRQKLCLGVALLRLRKNSDMKKGAVETLNRNFLRILNRTQNDVKASFEKLRVNCLQRKVSEARQHKALDKLKTACQRKELKVFYKSLVSQSKEELRTHLQRVHIRDLFQKLVMKREYWALRNIQDFAFHSHYMNRVKDKDKQAAMVNLIKNLNKNHAIIMRQAFTKWATRPKFNAFADLIKGLIRNRLHQAMSQIKLKSNQAKRDELMRQLSSLEDKIRRMRQERKKQAFETIKEQFHKVNTFEKAVINRWVLYTSLTPQHAFWRIRDTENIGSALVSVNKNLKLKKLLEIFQKASRKNFEKAFSSIQAVSQIKEVISSQMFASAMYPGAPRESVAPGPRSAFSSSKNPKPATGKPQQLKDLFPSELSTPASSKDRNSQSTSGKASHSPQPDFPSRQPSKDSIYESKLIQQPEQLTVPRPENHFSSFLGDNSSFAKTPSKQLEQSEVLPQPIPVSLKKPTSKTGAATDSKKATGPVFLQDILGKKK